MYIAQRWLTGMVLAMWIGLCSIDICLKDGAHLQLTEFNKLNDIMTPLLENSSILIQQKSFERKENKIRPVHHNNSIFLQFVTFMAGPCLVLVYYRKNNCVLNTIIKLKTINKHEMKKHYLRKIQTLRTTAKSVGVAIIKFLGMSMGKIEQLRIYFLTKYKQQSTSIRNPENVNLLLQNKLREYSLERRNLEHILLATMQQNKYIKMQYTLEALAKKRLVRQIQDTQKQMIENRSRYVSFQQLYTIAHQENNFLKSRIRKLTQDKEEAERNLIKLVNYVWQSKNNELKAYCSRLIVKTKNNLLNSDAKLEIDQFLKKSCKLKRRISEQESKKSHSLDTIKEVTENFREEADLTVIVKDAPKLRGLPGECVWTVKDKDGFIEKLYEYDTEFDNGDIIRKIRQYSVYYDKDCLLDVSSSTSSTNLIQSTNIDLSDLRSQYINKCITGSQAFQTFLKNNKIIALSRTRRSPQRAQLTY
nr:uncharacterized protein LOC117996094 [Maniola hyperantus]